MDKSEVNIDSVKSPHGLSVSFADPNAMETGSITSTVPEFPNGELDRNRYMWVGDVNEELMSSEVFLENTALSLQPGSLASSFSKCDSSTPLNPVMQMTGVGISLKKRSFLASDAQNGFDHGELKSTVL
ncbi:hypothetical protein OGAPHI_003351 [Ogataea philodendri]|uniref:Uncharacterized protein n=1 Tax=Ogataea philodendri TaxID=1378263 RepID=A0A9P8T5L2_9ASCO|nr:uncharacterized protein OGAPHI_003351 [Ogataea philodendri]KAH3666901.1 hypothetical protein OGAPHI_003351 [Ogataea philodendri]